MTLPLQNRPANRRAFSPFRHAAAWLALVLVLCLAPRPAAAQDFPADGCVDYSTLACADLPQSLPVTLDFNGGEGGLVDGADVGTGFPALVPPSARFEGAPLYSDLEGYAPDGLSVNDGQLAITATKGIFYNKPGTGPGTSTNTNSQLNALAVPFDAGTPAGSFVFETELAALPTPGSKEFQQAGLWFGLGEANYAKLVLISSGNGGTDYDIQLGYEEGDLYDGDLQQDVTDVAAAGESVTLRLEMDPITRTARGYYSTDGGATFTEVGGGIQSIAPALFSGVTLTDGETGPVSFAGLFATTRRGPAGLTFNFERFSAEATEAPLTNSGEIAFENRDWQFPSGVTEAGRNHFDGWLAFNRVTDDRPGNNGSNPPLTHDRATLRIFNESVSEPLEISEVSLLGNASNNRNIPAYALPNGEDAQAAPIVIEPGGFYDLDVAFVYDRPANSGANEVVRAQLSLRSSDGDEGVKTVELGGAWQRFVEGGSEPNVAEIVDAFGFGTSIVEQGQQINNQGRIEAIGEEILSPFWRRADEGEPVFVRQLAAYHTCCSNTAAIFLQRSISGGGTDQILRHDGQHAQAFLPPLSGSGNLGQSTVTPPSDLFGFKIDPEWSDWDRNRQPNDGDEGHHLRVWPARDAGGELIPNAYLVVMDYAGINYDFNDNVYYVTNIEPADDPDEVPLLADKIPVELDVALSASEDQVDVGAPYTYTLKVKNTRPYFAARDVTAELPLPEGASFASAGEGCTESGGVVTCEIGELASGQAQTFEIGVEAPGAEGTLTAAATASVYGLLFDFEGGNNTSSPGTFTASASADVEVVDPSQLPGQITIVKEATPEGDQAFSFAGDLGAFSLTDDGTPGGTTPVEQYNFQPSGFNTPGGYAADAGAAYGPQANGETYGWRAVDDDAPIDAGTNARDRGRNGVAAELNTLMHLQYNDCCAGSSNGLQEHIYWEHDLPTGTYEVTVSLGDQPSGQNDYDSQHQVSIEGESAPEQPFQADASEEFRAATATVEVTDGALTIRPTGFNTKLNYIVIEAVNAAPNTALFAGLAPGTYSVSENVPDGWTLDDVTCSDANSSTDAGGASATISLEGDEDVTCTFAASSPAALNCSPYSALPCDEVVAVDLPVSLGFSGDEGGLADESGTGTGFFTAAPPSARLSEDDPVSNTFAPGYEPGRLSVTGGRLQILTTPGIFYKQPTGPDGTTSSETNSQLNALAVPFDANLGTDKLVVQTAMPSLPTTASNKSYEQAGLWFGLGEADYLKLVLIDNNNGASYNVQVGYEEGDLYDDDQETTTTSAVAQPGDAVVLRLEIDPATGTATGSYSTDGGATFTDAGHIAGISDALFEGVDHDADAATGPVSFAGVMASQRRADDAVTFSFDDFRLERQAEAFATQINFQDEGLAPPAGYLKDFGQPFGERTGAGQGSGLSYGWVDPQTGEPVDLAGAGNGAGRDRTGTGQGDTRLASLIHMDYPVSDDYPSGRYPNGSWEIAVPNGSYEVTLAVGDADVGSDPEVHAINVEGTEAIYAFTPSGNDGSDARHTSVTVQVGVEDGRLTIDQAGGTNTKLNYADISQILPTRPYAFTVSPENRSDGFFRDGAISTNLFAPGSGVGVDIGTLDGNVHLYAVNADGSNGAEVTGNVGSSGGNDVIVFTPNDLLDANAPYRFVVDGGPGGVQSETGDDFLPFASVFTTGTEVESGGGSDEFEPVTNATFEPVDLGIDGVYFSSLVVGPDGKLYGLAVGGQIYRYTILPDGTLADEEILDGVGGDGPRVPIGLVFDEDATANNLVAWVTHASFAGLEGLSEESQRWGSKVTRLSGPDLETVNDVFLNLPRSAKDHLTNSIAYGPDGDLYFLQGSNLAAGVADNSWGSRPETKLAAAVLTFDEDAVWQEVQQSGPIDVMTDEPWPGGADPRTGSYDPYAPGAPLKVYATGIRNAYDLVWHSNGSLYVPTNGTAAGGESPDFDPASPPQGLDCQRVRPDGRSASELPFVDGVHNNPGATGVQGTHEKQRDFVFRVEEGGYYGHPNPSRCEWVLNIGNPDADPNEPGEGQGGSRYPAGTQPDPNYRGYPNFTSGPQGMGTAVWDLDFNKSPNGAIEYRGGNFGGEMQGRLLFVRFSGNDDVYTMQVDGQSGAFLGAQPGSEIDGFTGINGTPYDDPLEITENPATGDIYLAQYDRGGGNPKLFLLRPTDRPDGAETPLLATSEGELIFSARDNPGITQVKTVTVTNSGIGTLTISAADLTGANADEFSVTPQTATLDAGASQTFTVTFDPADDVNQTRVLEAALTFESNAGSGDVGLFALSTKDYEGGNEPPLQDVIATLGYDIDTGWSGLTSSTEASERGDERYVPLFEKANPQEPVTVVPVARFSPAEDLPFGWYTPDGTSTPPLNQVGTLADGKPEHQMLLPPLSGGATTFDPGTEAFGIYTESLLFGHVRYTEDALNSIPRAVRIYPLDANSSVDRRGENTANHYLVGFEDATNGDYQDYVFVVSNVQPAGTTEPPAFVEVPFRFNVGGEVIDETSYGSFGADQAGYLTGSSEVSFKDFEVAGTEDDDLYLTYRYGATPNDGGDDFGYAIPLEDGQYTVRLHFLEPYFGAPGGGDGGTGQRVFSVDVEGGQDGLTGFDLNAEAPAGTAIVRTFENITVTDGALDLGFSSSVNSAIVSAVEVLAEEQPPVASCVPYSTLDCADVPAALPFALSFDGSEGGLAGGSGQGTGFTMVDPPSARLAVDDPVFNADVPGYEPGHLSVTGGQLVVTSTKGIQYSQPSGTPSSTETNSQINALGVGVEGSSVSAIETVVVEPDFASSSGNNSQQAGLWFGLGEDRYAKLVVSKTGNASAKVQLFLEDLPNSEDFVELNTVDSAIPNPADQTILLRMELDAAAGTATGFYSLDGGATMTPVSEDGASALDLPADFFAGVDHDADAATEAVSFTGLFTTHRRAAVGESISFAFERFGIESGAPADDALIAGAVNYYDGRGLSDATLALTGDATASAMTEDDGAFGLTAAAGETYALAASKANVSGEDPANGLDVNDLALVRRHTQNVVLLDSPYKIIAADADADGDISVNDLALVRRIISGADEDFEPGADNGALWTCAVAGQAFDDPSAPFPYETERTYEPLEGDAAGQDFHCFRTGDVDASWAPEGGQQAPAFAARLAPSGPPVRLFVEDQDVAVAAPSAQATAEEAAAEVSVPVRASAFENVGGLQFTMTWDDAALDYAGLEGLRLDGLSESNFNLERTEEGLLTLVWTDPSGMAQTLPDGEALFSVRFRAKGSAGQDAEVAFGSSVTKMAASRVQPDGEGGPGRLERAPLEGQSGRLALAELPAAFALQGTYPNPTRGRATLALDLPEAADVAVEVYDLLGRRVMRLAERRLPAGAARTLALDASALPSGLYLYRVTAQTDGGARKVSTGKLTLVK